MSASFEECWDEFRRRTFPRYAAFIQLFKEKYSSAFENATSILDIGAGDGDFDVLLIKELLPRLSEYNAVESDGDLCKTLEQKISQIKNRTIQVNVFNGFMEMYDGPKEPLDLIVMCAVAYYIPDKKAMIHQALNWLKSGGHFIMIHWPHDTPIQKGQDKIRAASSSSIDASFDGVPLLQEMKIKHTEHKIDVPFDVTKDGLEKVLRIVLHRTPTEQETEEFSSAMKPYAELKNERVYVNMPYSIIVIQKE